MSIGIKLYLVNNINRFRSDNYIGIYEKIHAIYKLDADTYQLQ